MCYNARGMKAGKELIERALAEDRVRQDKTSFALFPEEHHSVAFLIAGATGVLSGMEVARQVFQAVDRNIQFQAFRRDGESVRKGLKIARLKGRTRSLLSAERVALNFLMHLSGIATLTAKFVKVLQGTPVILLDTRKTLPGLRMLEKYAVRCGGGKNHRMNLAEAILLKSNHIRAFGSISDAVMLARKKYPRMWIEVEVQNLKEFQEALKTSADRIMLDNFSLPCLRKAVALSRKRTPANPIPLEASGGVTLKNARRMARIGVNFISAGVLTHSAPALNICMKIVRGKASPSLSMR